MKTPKGLSPEARRWWRRLMVEYEDWDPPGLLTLEAALQAFDRWREAQAQVDRDGLTVQDRFQQAHVHPACAVERDSRAAMVRAFRDLGLSDEPAAKLSASDLGRRAAMQRWHGREAV